MRAEATTAAKPVRVETPASSLPGDTSVEYLSITDALRLAAELTAAASAAIDDERKKCGECGVVHVYACPKTLTRPQADPS